MASVSLYFVLSSIQYMVCCNDIHLAMHSECGCALIMNSSQDWDLDEGKESGMTSLPMVMGLLSPCGSQITTTIVAGTSYAMILTREQCILFWSSSSASSSIRG